MATSLAAVLDGHAILIQGLLYSLFSTHCSQPKKGSRQVEEKAFHALDQEAVVIAHRP